MNNNFYREIEGFLQCIPLSTRPDITFAVNKHSQFLVNPGHAHLSTALRILRYLRGMKHWNLNLGDDITDIAGYLDLDWGGSHRPQIDGSIWEMI